MKYLIGFLVICMVLGPVMMLQPSPAQRRKTKLRNKAIALGMTVQYADLPEQKIRKQQTAEKWLAYSIRGTGLASSKKQKLPVWCLLRTGADAQWQWRDPVPALDCGQRVLTEAAGLPLSVQAMEYRHDQLTIYWKEQGAEQDVEQICAVLVAVRHCLTGE